MTRSAVVVGVLGVLLAIGIAGQLAVRHAPPWAVVAIHVVVLALVLARSFAEDK